MLDVRNAIANILDRCSLAQVSLKKTPPGQCPSSFRSFGWNSVRRADFQIQTYYLDYFFGIEI
jgi:hypothetical protein